MTGQLGVFRTARRTALLAVLLAATPAVWGPVASPAAARLAQTTLTVTTTADSGPGSLRQALMDAAAASEPGTVEIAFDIPDCVGPCRIQVSEALPEIAGSGLSIDGYTQPGASPATDDNSAVLRVELVGPGPAGPDGLRLTGSDIAVRGLAIHGFGGHGIAVDGSIARRIVVAGNHLGLDAEGAVGIGNAFSGIAVTSGAREVRVGGPDPADGNIIGGNVGAGVLVLGSGTRDVTIAGNRIGVDPTGQRPVANVGAGIRVAEGAQEVFLGRAATELLPAQAGNHIAANQGDGVRIEGNGTAMVGLRGNRIGLAGDGATALPNGGDGLHVASGARGITINGADGAARNLISGNTGNGVSLSFVDDVSISGTWIGTDVGGTVTLPNGGDGVRATDVTGLIVGGDAAAGNVISGNAGQGVHLLGMGVTGGIVAGNRIGSDAAGQVPLPNEGDGVRIAEGARDNVVGVVADFTPGPSAAPEGNLIVANAGAGVAILGAGSTGNVVAGNRIGISADGAFVLGNDGPGVTIAGGAAMNRIGGVSGPGGEAGNTIGGNAVGVRIEGLGTDANQVVGNRIGTTPDGAADLPNRGEGVSIGGGAVDGQVGPDNVIAFNGGDGVRVESAGTSGHRITRNAMSANGGAGIHLVDGANGGIAAPVLDAVPLPERRVTGMACASCVIELFGSTFDEGQGQRFVAETVADAQGAFAFDLPPAEESHFTTTASDDTLGTSAFSNVASAPPATPVPTATLGPPTTTATPAATSIPSATPSPTALPPSATPTVVGTATPGLSPTATTRATEPPPPTVPTPTDAPSATATDAPTATATEAPAVTPTTAPSPTATPSPVPQRWQIHLPIARKGT